MGNRHREGVEKMNLSQWGGTKFLATVGAGLATTILQWFGKLDTSGNAYMLTIIATVGAFITGNVVQAKNDAADPRSQRREAGGEK